MRVTPLLAFAPLLDALLGCRDARAGSRKRLAGSAFARRGFCQARKSRRYRPGPTCTPFFGKGPPCAHRFQCCAFVLVADSGGALETPAWTESARSRGGSKGVLGSCERCGRRAAGGCPGAGRRDRIAVVGRGRSRSNCSGCKATQHHVTTTRAAGAIPGPEERTAFAASVVEAVRATMPPPSPHPLDPVPAALVQPDALR